MEISKAQTLTALTVSTFILLLIFSSNAIDLSSDAAEYLAAHNQLRGKKGVAPLEWDEKMVNYAQAWATQRINDCDHRHHSGGPYGENTFWEQYDEYSPSAVAKVWADEEKNYNHNKLECNCYPETSKCMCGHYTQVVWSGTNRVGCANVTCNDELGLLIVCSYDPPGNYQGENPFEKPSTTTTMPPPVPGNYQGENPFQKPTTTTMPPPVPGNYQGDNSFQKPTTTTMPPPMPVPAPPGPSAPPATPTQRQKKRLNRLYRIVKRHFKRRERGM